jgi:hypothetical protein
VEYPIPHIARSDVRINDVLNHRFITRHFKDFAFMPQIKAQICAACLPVTG